MIHVYVDDMRPCPAGFMAARSAMECILLLKECEVDILSLDYDLGWHAPNATEIVQWILASGRFPRRLYFHTSSSAGRDRMIQLLLPALPAGIQLFHGPMPDHVLQEAAVKRGNE